MKDLLNSFPDHWITQVDTQKIAANWINILIGDFVEGCFIHNPLPKQDTGIFTDSTEDAVMSSSPQGSEPIPELDLTGSPLKAPFEIIPNGSLNDSVQSGPKLLEGYQAGFPIGIVRKMLQYYHPKLSSENKEKLVLCVCNGEDVGRTWMMGLQTHQGLTYRHLLKKFNEPRRHEDFSLLRCMQQHQPYALGLKVDSFVFASYNANNVDGKDNSTVDLHCSWSGCSELLQEPPLGETVTVSLKINSHDKNSLLLDMYKDLSILTDLSVGLATKNVTWATHPDENYKVADTLTEFLENLRQWFTGKKERDARKGSTPKENSDQALLTLRKKLDFTDFLWDILKYCSSYQQLVQCLKMVFAALATSKLRPEIFSRNGCGMAAASLRILKGGGAGVSLEGSEPISLLVGMGIEKLKRDYLFAYAELEIAGMHHLQELALNEVGGLWVLHQGLECTMLCRYYLKLSTQLLGGPVRKLLQEIPTEPPTSPLHYSFPLQSVLLQKILEELSASVWRLRLVSEEKNERGETTSVVVSNFLFSDFPLDQCLELFSSDLNPRRGRVGSNTAEIVPTSYYNHSVSLADRL